MANNQLLGFIQTPDEVDKPRFNPVDGKIYADIPGINKMEIIDPQQGAFGAIVGEYTLPTGCSNGVDIDSITNTAYLVCAGGLHATFNLTTGKVVATSPLGGGDVAEGNPHNRRMYIATNQTALPTGVTLTGNCPKASTGAISAILVYSAANATNPLVGATCTGARSGHAVNGVDAIHSYIFVPVPQYPADPASANTGSPGILAFRDPAPRFTGTTAAGAEEAWVNANLSAVGGSGVSGGVDITLRRRNMAVEGTLTGLPPGSGSVRMIIETTVGHESIPCGVDSTGKGYCEGDLMGDPLTGGPVNVASGVNRVASGTLTLQLTWPTFISID